jgi:ABC-type glycerol-3-phosphate transport system substrate-binding protein
VSQFLSILLLATALALTVCLGVAASRQSADRDVDITATIPHQENGWREAEQLKSWTSKGARR